MTPLAHDSSAPRGWTQEHSSVLSPAFYQSTGPRRLQRPQQHCGRPSSAASSGSRLPPPSVALPHPTPELAQSFSMLPIGMPAHVPSAAALFAEEALQSHAAWPPAVAGGAERPAEQPSAALILGVESSFAAAPSTPPGGGSVEAGLAAAPPAGRQLSPVPSAALRRLEKKRTSTCVHQQKHEAHAQQVREPVLRALRGVPYFAQVAAEHDEALLACAELIEHPRYAVIVREGIPSEVSRAFYVILSGQVRVIQGQIDGISRALLGPGDYFGEAALVSHFPRMATLIAVTDARVLRLKSGALFAQPWFVQTVEPCRQAITKLVLLRLLRQLRAFARFSDDMLQKAAPLFEYREYPAEAVISAEGDESSEVYIITHGEVLISTRGGSPGGARRGGGGGGEQIRGRSGGDQGEIDLGCVRSTDAKPWVGEMSALSNQPRMATIRAAEPVQALVLSPQHFVALLGLAPYLVEEFQVTSRYLANIASSAKISDDLTAWRYALRGNYWFNQIQATEAHTREARLARDPKRGDKLMARMKQASRHIAQDAKLERQEQQGHAEPADLVSAADQIASKRRQARS